MILSRWKSLITRQVRSLSKIKRPESEIKHRANLLCCQDTQRTLQTIKNPRCIHIAWFREKIAIFLGFSDGQVQTWRMNYKCGEMTDKKKSPINAFGSTANFWAFGNQAGQVVINRYFAELDAQIVVNLNSPVRSLFSSKIFPELKKKTNALFAVTQRHLIHIIRNDGGRSEIEIRNKKFFTTIRSHQKTKEDDFSKLLHRMGRSIHSRSAPLKKRPKKRKPTRKSTS